MIKDRQILINEYVKSLHDCNASIFLGAGFSFDVFKKDWSKLLAPYATKLGIGSTKHLNLPQVAQAYADKFSSEALKKSISKKFLSNSISEKHRLIARLPIQNYWTTNYDHLIENALNIENKHYDKIFNNASFSSVDGTRERIVFKCHGDCDNPESIIITQDDYDVYNYLSFNFVNSLLKELAANTILFLGYSFNDTDINNLLAQVKIHSEIPNLHYLITKKEDKARDRTKQKLWIANLERYGIQTLLVEDYNDIVIILKEIERQYMSSKVLISGSAETYDEYGTNEKAQDLISRLGFELVESDNEIEIINGNGKGVGPILNEGVAEAVAKNNLDLSKNLTTFPFSKKYYEKFEKEPSIEEQWHLYRSKMVSKCGIVFFIFGNRYNDNGEIVNAPGVRKEFEIACSQNKYVFPIGATGYMAKELADLVLSDFEKYNGKMPRLKKALEELNTPHLQADKIIEQVKFIVETLAHRPENK